MSLHMGPYDHQSNSQLFQYESKTLVSPFPFHINPHDHWLIHYQKIHFLEFLNPLFVHYISSNKQLGENMTIGNIDL
jgi:hypothetical protein